MIANPSVPSHSVSGLNGVPSARAPLTERVLSTPRFDLAISLASTWFVGGLYLDGWAHNTIPSLETFFTPWHGVLYSGFLATLAVLGWGIGRNHTTGRSWWRAVPAGYAAAAIGSAVFVVAGLGDMLWHIAFGIEADMAALLSPTHLLLLIGGSLFLAGPLVASQRRLQAGRADAGMLAQLPRILALTFLLLSVAFFTQYANPWGAPWAMAHNQPMIDLVPTAGGVGVPAAFLLQALSIASVLFQAVVLAGFVAFALRQGRLPTGSLTLMIGLYVALTVVMRQKYDTGFQLPLIVAGLLAGGVSDLLYVRLRPAIDRPYAFQLFLALVPALATAAYLGALGVSEGVWWSIHVWSGAVVLAGGAGWLISLVAQPAGYPTPERLIPPGQASTSAFT
jgi:hypothetical protein